MNPKASCDEKVSWEYDVKKYSALVNIETDIGEGPEECLRVANVRSGPILGNEVVSRSNCLAALTVSIKILAMCICTNYPTSHYVDMDYPLGLSNLGAKNEK